MSRRRRRLRFALSSTHAVMVRLELCYGSSAGKYGSRDIASALEQILQGVGIDGVIDRVVECSVNCSDIRQELGGLDGDRISYIDDVLVAHLERGCEELAAGISEIDIVDYGDDGPLELGTVDAHRLGNLAGFTSIDKY